MMSKYKREKRGQIQMLSIEDLVPKDHILRDIEELYSPDHGRPSIDPVILFKIIFIKYLFEIRSIRQTIREIEVNMAYRWYIGYFVNL